MIHRLNVERDKPVYPLSLLGSLCNQRWILSFGFGCNRKHRQWSGLRCQINFAVPFLCSNAAVGEVVQEVDERELEEARRRRKQHDEDDNEM
jgi:hypothetical protein